MACLSDLPELLILGPGDWGFPPLIQGLVPLMWTTGSYDPLAQDGNPWFGLVIPQKFDWHGSSLEITYFSGGVQYGGCFVTFPPTTVKIHQSCTSGFHQFLIEVFAGNRRFHRNIWNVPGSWKVTNSVLTHGDSPFCSDKFLKGSTIKEMDFRTLVRWISLMRDNTLASSGFSPDWYNFTVANMSNDSIGLRDICVGCEYGLLPKANNPTSRKITSVVSDLNKVSFPVSESELPGYVQTCAKSAIVIQKDLSYTAYMELKQSCLDPWLISGTGLLSVACIKDEPKLPDDQDPRWIPEYKSTVISCVQSQRFVTGFYEYRLSNTPVVGIAVGVYPVERNAPNSALGNSSFLPFERFSNDTGALVTLGGLYDVPNVTVIFRTQWGILETTTTNIVERGKATVTKVETKVIAVFDTVDYSVNTGPANANSWPSPLSGQKASSALTTIVAQNLACGNNRNITYPIPPLVPKYEQGEKDKSKCYVKGEFQIDLLFFIQKNKPVDSKQLPNTFSEEMRGKLKDKVISKLNPFSVRIPFKFRWNSGPSPSTQLLGGNVVIVGTVLQVTTPLGVFTTSLEEIFNIYNFADTVGLMKLIVPGPLSLKNLEAFCEL